MTHRNNVNTENPHLNPVGKLGLPDQTAPSINVRRPLGQATNVVQNKLKDGSLKPKGVLYKSVVDLKKHGSSLISHQGLKVKVEKADENGAIAGPKPPLRTKRILGERQSLIPRPSLARSVKTVTEEPSGFSAFYLPSDVENIDSNDGNNVLLATEYINDIYTYLRQLEVS